MKPKRLNLLLTIIESGVFIDALDARLAMSRLLQTDADLSYISYLVILIDVTHSFVFLCQNKFLQLLKLTL
jgi:hypothetical protein